MDGYISKPINVTELFETIENCLKVASAEETPAPSTDDERPRLDKAALLERVGGDMELLGELVALFMDDGPRLLDEIRQAVRVGEAEILARTAHTLKGSVGNFAADDAFQAALQLEKIGREGEMHLAGGALEELEREIQGVLNELSAFAPDADDRVTSVC